MMPSLSESTMATSTEIAQANLFEANDLSVNQLSELMGKLMAGSVEQADLYFQASAHESWVLENGVVKDGSFEIEQGVGVRAISGQKVGFAYCEDMQLPNLRVAVDTAQQIANQGQAGRLAVTTVAEPKTSLYMPDNPQQQLAAADKVALLQSVDQKVRALDSRVVQVNASLSSEYDVVSVLSSDGQLAADVRPLVRLDVSVILEVDGRRERGSAGGGGRFAIERLQQQVDSYAEEAVRLARLNLDAKPAPAGVMPVVLGPGWPGVLLHEAIGHGLEGDFNRKGTSAFSGRVGERVASDVCTVVDEGCIAGRRGSLNIDDEGTPTQRTVLIENGILKGYLQDKLNAKLMGTQSTGNGRRESYAHVPMPRMTNTFMLAGESDPAEIIASVDKGLYAVNFGGGQVDITSGKFVFSTKEAYLIENGKITTPVKDAMLVGHGPDVLTKVSMVGNDLALDTGVGVCGKDGQSVPVGVGQPTLRVDELTVGGTQVAT